MVDKKYTIDLSENERAELGSFVSHGKRIAQAIIHARILLRADEGVSDPNIADAFDRSAMTAHRARKRYCEDGIAAIHRRNPDRELSVNSPEWFTDNSRVSEVSSECSLGD